MITYFKHLLFDEKAFLGAFRGLVLALSGVFLSGKLDFDILPDNLATIVPAIGLFLAGFVRSSGTSGDQAERKP